MYLNLYLEQSENTILIISLSLSLSYSEPAVGPIPAIKWLSSTAMTVSWSPISLVEARGFPTGYIITYSSTSDERRRQVEGGTRTVSADETSVTIDGLNSERQYAVSVAATTVAGAGDSSNPVTAPSKSNCRSIIIIISELMYI